MKGGESQKTNRWGDEDKETRSRYSIRTKADQGQLFLREQIIQQKRGQKKTGETLKRGQTKPGKIKRLITH